MWQSGIIIKEDIWCSLTPQVKANGALLVVFWHKKGDILFGWVIRGSGKLHCVRFIAHARRGGLGVETPILKHFEHLYSDDRI